MSMPKTMLWLCLALSGFVVLTGCRGCNTPLVERDKKLEDEEKKKKKPEEDFEFQLARTVPADDTLAAPLVKPGHWVTFAHDLKANNGNVRAELHTSATDRDSRPFFVDRTPFKLTSSRPAPLPKGQAKRFETPYFIPRETTGAAGKTVGLHRELRAAPSGNLLKMDWQPVMNMEGYQYFFMVLAADPDRFGYLKRLASVSAPVADDFNTDAYLYYRVLLPKLDRIAPLPSNPLTWTSIAYILWDDADPNMLTPDQCQALLDWLNWGGQLIINGPNTLEKLQGTFLEEYLPASASKTVEIDQAAIDEINEYWAVTNGKTGGRHTLNVLPGKPLIGVQLDKHPLAEPVAHTGGLVIERQIGGGRIVVTAFSLSDRTIVNWPSFDSFFNAGLLRRPRRMFSSDSNLTDVRWTDYHRSLVRDARLVTTLRYFSRDIGHFTASVREPGYVEPGEEIKEVSDAEREMMLQTGPPPTQQDLDPTSNDSHFLGYPIRQKSGMAAWNDQSGASDASREALKVAAGISIPKGEFVLKVLAVYLIVLAPVNWAFFRMMGRVEWAWVAAPIMAIIGAVAVVRLAQLDIGFARSVTEIGIVEAQGGYSRAHVTRYTALYTSLSSSYDLVFDESGSLAQPFSSNTNFVLGLHDPTYTVSLRRDKELRLSGFQVASNSTETVHCEQMADLGGVFRLSGDDAAGFRLNNGTPVSLKGVGVLRRTLGGAVQTCWIDDLPAGLDVSVPFETPDDGLPRMKQWDEVSATFSFERQADEILRRYDRDEDKRLSSAEIAVDAAMAVAFGNFDRGSGGRGAGDGQWDRGELLAWCRSSRFGELSLGQLFDLASLELRLRPGDVRLVGWSDENLPGMAIRPSAAQEARRNLFVVHLQRGPLTQPRPDVNSISDFVQDAPKAEIDSGQDPAQETSESE